MGPVLGIDYGLRHVGIAISDPDGIVAFSRETITFTSRIELLETLDVLIQEEGVEEVVVGLPLALSGKDTEQTGLTRLFAEELRVHCDVRVHLEDERLTSAEAALLQRDDTRASSGSVHGGSAQLLLQSWLDRRAS